MKNGKIYNQNNFFILIFMLPQLNVQSAALRTQVMSGLESLWEYQLDLKTGFQITSLVSAIKSMSQSVLKKETRLNQIYFYGLLSQLAEEIGSNPIKSGFESQVTHQKLCWGQFNWQSTGLWLRLLQVRVLSLDPLIGRN